MDTIIGNITAAISVTRAVVRGTAAVIIVHITIIETTLITETDAGAMLWAKLLVAIIVLLKRLQTGACGITTTRGRSETDNRESR